jgi:hypothetical protein
VCECVCVCVCAIPYYLKNHAFCRNEMKREKINFVPRTGKKTLASCTNGQWASHAFKSWVIPFSFFHQMSIFNSFFLFYSSEEQLHDIPSLHSDSYSHSYQKLLLFSFILILASKSAPLFLIIITLAKCECVCVLYANERYARGEKERKKEREREKMRMKMKMSINLWIQF